MANRNTQGFGLIPAGTLGQTPATSGTGKYKIDAGYTTTIYHGGAVASNAGYIIDGQTTGGVTHATIECTVLASGKWLVSVVTGGTGDLATPFSAAVS